MAITVNKLKSTESTTQQTPEPGGEDLRNLAELFIRASTIYEWMMTREASYEGRQDFGEAVSCAADEVSCYGSSNDAADEICGLLDLAIQGFRRHQYELAEYARRKRLGLER